MGFERGLHPRRRRRRGGAGQPVGLRLLRLAGRRRGLRRPLLRVRASSWGCRCSPRSWSSVATPSGARSRPSPRWAAIGLEVGRGPLRAGRLRDPVLLLGHHGLDGTTSRRLPSGGRPRGHRGPLRRDQRGARRDRRPPGRDAAHHPGHHPGRPAGHRARLGRAHAHALHPDRRPGGLGVDAVGGGTRLRLLPPAGPLEAASRRRPSPARRDRRSSPCPWAWGR